MSSWSHWLGVRLQMSDGCCCEFMLLFSEFISLTDYFIMTEPLPILLLTCFYYELKGGESVLPLLGIIWQYLMHMRYDWKKGVILILLTQMDSLTQNCGGSLIRTFSLGPTDTKLDPFRCFFLMAEGEILISIDTDGFLDPKLWGGR